MAQLAEARAGSGSTAGVELEARMAALLARESELLATVDALQTQLEATAAGVGSDDDEDRQVRHTHTHTHTHTPYTGAERCSRASTSGNLLVV